MDLLKQEYAGNIVTLFDLRLSEDEITVYLDCINFMMKHCSDEQVAQFTACESKEELSWFRDNLLNLLKGMEHKEYLPDRYK